MLDPPPDQGPLSAGSRRFFRQELPGTDTVATPGWIRWLGGRLDVRTGEGTEVLAPGWGGLGGHAPVPPPVAGEPEPLLGVLAGSLAVGSVIVSGEVRSHAAVGAPVRELFAATGAGPVEVWAGRRAPAHGMASGGAIVLSGAVPLDGGGLRVSQRLLLPSLLRHLGPLGFETHLARFGEHGHIHRPWFWTARGSIAPHPRLSLAINRGAVFGGDPAPAVTFRDVALMVFGMRRDEADDGFGRTAFANQVVSLEARYRLPVGRWPASVYLEWGAEDSAGSWKDVPGIIAGAHVEAVPGVQGVSVGLERTYFAASCCGNPAWYRHHHFSGGWAYRDQPLGHALGGHGDEWRLYGRADLFQARLRGSWALFHRERGEENLYAPDREGRSAGAELKARYRVTPWLELTFDGRIEGSVEGAGWWDGQGFFGLRTHF